MLKPSYKDLMDITNSYSENDEKIISSRYSIVMAASKRARQISLSRNANYSLKDGEKALSIAIKELETGKVKIESAENK